MQRLSLIFLSLMLVVSPIKLWADPVTDIYQIEIIIFENNDPARFKAENWPKFVNKIEVGNAVNLDKLTEALPESFDTLEILDALDDAGDVPVKQITKESVNLITPKNYLLTKELKMIKSSKDKRFIKHMAWNQPLANNVKSTPVYFTGGTDKEITTFMYVKPSRTGFNINIDLLYKLPVEDRAQIGIDEIKINRDVKVKKREIYYVDHPVIGMIVTVSPILYGTTSYSPLPNL